MYNIKMTVQRVKDDWANGEIGDREWVCERNFRQDDLPLDKLMDVVFDEIGAVWRGNLILIKENNNMVLFERNETGEGKPLTPQDVENWKAGKLTVYLVTYFFTITTVLPVPMEDISGILNEPIE